MGKNVKKEDEMDVIKNQLDHRTVRKFKDIKIEDETLKKLFEVYNSSASSTGMQQASIIRVTDPSIKHEIMKVSTQKYLENVPELLIFIVDLYRNYRISIEKGYESDAYSHMDKFFQGFTDSVIGAQNMVVAIESLDMGAVYFGSILNNYDRIIELLKLPKYTFPVVGLGFGYPDEKPQLKPRIPIEFKVFENEYKQYDNYLETFSEYDEVMTTYYDTRDNGRRSDCFTDQVVSKFMAMNEIRRDVIKSIEKQGFEIRK